jgi:hypothetical protein
MGGGLSLELGAQPPGLASGAPQPPFGALGVAGEPGQREQALGGPPRLGGREPLAVLVGGELGELVHGGHLRSRRWRACCCAPLSPAGAGGHHTQPRTGRAQD